MVVFANKLAGIGMADSRLFLFGGFIILIIG